MAKKLTAPKLGKTRKGYAEGGVVESYADRYLRMHGVAADPAMIARHDKAGGQQQAAYAAQQRELAKPAPVVEQASTFVPSQSIDAPVDPANPYSAQSEAKYLQTGHYAEGGVIKGPGTGSSDSIPAKLSDGEFIIPAHIVKKFGVDFFNDLIGNEEEAQSVNGVVHAALGGSINTDDNQLAAITPNYQSVKQPAAESDTTQFGIMPQAGLQAVKTGKYNDPIQVNETYIPELVAKNTSEQIRIPANSARTGMGERASLATVVAPVISPSILGSNQPQGATAQGATGTAEGAANIPKLSGSAEGTIPQLGNARFDTPAKGYSLKTPLGATHNYNEQRIDVGHMVIDPILHFRCHAVIGLLHPLGIVFWVNQHIRC